MPAIMTPEALEREFKTRIQIAYSRWTCLEAKELRTDLMESVRNVREGPVLIDLRSVDFVDSIGIGLLVAAIVDLKKAGFMASIAYTREVIGETFQTVGLEYFVQCVHVA